MKKIIMHNPTDVILKKLLIDVQ